MKSHTSAPSITTESILRIPESQSWSHINGFPDCHRVEREAVVIVQIEDIAFCVTV